MKDRKSQLQKQTRLTRNRSVALQDVTPQQISGLEDDLSEVLEKLRKIRQGMAENDVQVVNMEIKKAAGFLEYLKVEWATTCWARYEKSVAKRKAEKKSEELKTRQTKSR